MSILNAAFLLNLISICTNIFIKISAIYSCLDLIDPDLNNDTWFLEQTILYPKNDTVDALNMQCLNTLRGDVHTYYSAKDRG
jgi:hypothetical protein